MNQCSQLKKSFLHQYWLLAFVIIYNAINFFMSCLYNSVILDPWQLIWGFLFVIAGPLFIIISLIVLIKALIKEKKVDVIVAVSSIACISSVIIWSFGFWGIGSYFRPKIFKFVAEQNEQLVVEAIRNLKDPNHVIVSKFRYPYFRMSTFGHYKGGVLYLLVPGGPESNDNIIYDPNKVVPKGDLDHLTGPWYYHYAGH